MIDYISAAAQLWVFSNGIYCTSLPYFLLKNPDRGQ
jgi:hypothetical protein